MGWSRESYLQALPLLDFAHFPAKQSTSFSDPRQLVWRVKQVVG
jgi:hypothetical protein